jgi:diguanylate cyclase (GGDEF)-like protein
MNKTITHFPAGTTARASLAGLAAVGIVFLVPTPQFRDLASVTVPTLAMVLLITMQLLHSHLSESWTAQGKAIAQIDPITSLPSLPVAELVLSTEFAAAERGRELAVVLCRFEGFQRFRTAHGQEAAERLLTMGGRVLKRRTRGMNLSARHDDNGTFVSILSGQSPAGARIFAERVQKDLQALEVAGRPQRVSVGIAAYDMHIKSPGHLVIAAEKAVRSAEQAGAAIVVHDSNAMIFS